MNIKPMTLDELRYFIDRYEFSIINDFVLVLCKDGGKKTFHNINEGFRLTSPMRKVNIHKDAILLWKEKYYGKYSLVEVQNAMNTLLVTYQVLNDTQLENQLNRTHARCANEI